MILAVALTAISLLGTAPHADLVDDMGQAGDAEFTARQLVVCWGDDGAVARVSDVVQSDGMTRVAGPDGTFVIGDGKMIEQYAGGIRYLEMSPTSAWRLWDGYQMTTDPPDVASVLSSGRTVEVTEGGRIRARFVLDEQTGTPLSTQVYDGDGSLYRYSVMMEFRPGDADAMSDMDDMPDPEYRAAASAIDVPSVAGHYWAADSYAAPGGVQVFFTDGLFRFSVFEVSRKSDGGGLSDAPDVEIAGQSGYHRTYTPGAVSVFWRTADRAYVLVGDLPPDHLEAVLQDLPEPGRPNILKRAWRWAFG
ncbi:MAG: hypothetical protein KJO17_08740 [Acidimicrobiia bacterium]|nr:hypothetical protein [Acidimicrobiia bacterium]NNL69428.1 hypothetical protein [Acidimicrobiia bacterium]